MAAGQTGVKARVEVRTDKAPGARARVFVGAGASQVEVTGAMVGAIAHALWQARGGESMTNWADAEVLVDQLFAPVLPAREIKPPAPEKTGNGLAPKKKPSRR